MHPAISWLERKLGETTATISEPRTVSKEFNRHSGGRSHFAGLTISLKPASQFSIHFLVEPSEADYRWAIEDSIFTELLNHYRQPITRVSVVIESVREDAVDSNYISFKMVTIEAMKDALSANILWK